MTQDEVPSRHEVWRMFDRIAGRYDLLNRLLSMRQDVRWRKRMAHYLPKKARLNVLDLATGTGDQLLSLVAQSEQIEKGIGLDLSEKMLDIGKEKIERLGKSGQLKLDVGDACDLSRFEEEFDVVTISFGIRNVTNVPLALSEMHRVLQAGGRALILECSLPRSAIARRLYLLYFRHVLPVLGGIISGDFKAYRYLNKTVETFPYGEAFCHLMSDAGFNTVEAHPLFMGVATIYVGEKADEGSA